MIWDVHGRTSNCRFAVLSLLIVPCGLTVLEQTLYRPQCIDHRGPNRAGTLQSPEHNMQSTCCSRPQAAVPHKHFHCQSARVEASLRA